MKTYKRPEIKISRFSVQDIITTSGDPVYNDKSAAAVLQNGGVTVTDGLAEGINVADLLKQQN